MVCLVVTGALAYVNSVTDPIIQAAAAERMQVAMSEIIPSAQVFEDISADTLPTEVIEAYIAKDDSGSASGYIFIVASNGFGGEMRVICGVDADGRIIEARVLQHSETKGIGDYIDSRSFTSKFDSKDRGSLGEVDTVSGASITFRAFVSAIEYALGAYEVIGK